MGIVWFNFKEFMMFICVSKKITDIMLSKGAQQNWDNAHLQYYFKKLKIEKILCRKIEKFTFEKLLSILTKQSFLNEIFKCDLEHWNNPIIGGPLHKSPWVNP